MTWDYETSAIGKTRVVVVSPETTERLPVLVALHGLGEAQKGPQRGARGWVDDYGLSTALERLKGPPLTAEDLQKLGTSEHLAALNARLAEQPFRGLIIVCPYTPDILGTARSLDAAGPLAAHIVDEVLPRVYEETPALGTARSTGIDGVSLGGRAALLVGLAHPDRFGAVGSMQAAIYDPDLEVLTTRVLDARKRKPSLALRLLTSSHDFYRPTIARLSKKLKQEGVAHDHEVIERGPHSYGFNRGLGVYAMLTFHDRALR
jgi:pimeloyl-ACP methyl ester carboxylesterase